METFTEVRSQALAIAEKYRDGSCFNNKSSDRSQRNIKGIATDETKNWIMHN